MFQSTNEKCWLLLATFGTFFPERSHNKSLQLSNFCTIFGEVTEGLEFEGIGRYWKISL